MKKLFGQIDKDEKYHKAVKQYIDFVIHSILSSGSQHVDYINEARNFVESINDIEDLRSIYRNRDNLNFLQDDIYARDLEEAPSKNIQMIFFLFHMSVIPIIKDQYFNFPQDVDSDPVSFSLKKLFLEYIGKYGFPFFDLECKKFKKLNPAYTKNMFRELKDWCAADENQDIIETIKMDMYTAKRQVNPPLEVYEYKAFNCMDMKYSKDSYALIFDK